MDNDEVIGITSNNQLNRIKKLMFAVIWQSIVDYVNIEDTDSIYLSAERWLFSDNLSYDYSFRRLSENIGYNYKPFRMVAKKLRQGGIKIRQNGSNLLNIGYIN